MSNKRVFYACQAAAFSKCGANSFTAVHGLQSIGVSTKFNLEQVFEMGQVSIYDNVENIPDIEITMEKCLDGYPLIYHLATNGATSPSLSGRSNVKATVGLSIYSDVQDSASGTPLSQCTMSGVFVSALNYNFQVQGNSTESVTLVGNNKIWTNSFTAPTFTNADSPQATHVLRRQNVVFGSAGCKLPTDIPGITASGTNELNGAEYTVHFQSMKVSSNLGREALYELGRRGTYHRYVSFPVQVQSDFEILSKETGDSVQALEDANSNVSNQTIQIKTDDTTLLNLGTKNKLSSVNYTGGNAGQQGGNATITFSYITFSDLTVTHPQDPSGL